MDAPQTVTDPVLQPRLEVMPNVSDETLRLFKDSLVWDNTMPWTTECNNAYLDEFLPRWHSAGVNYVSISANAVAWQETVESVERCAAQVRERSDFLTLASSLDDIYAAKADGKLAIGFSFQETLPFDRDLDNVERFYQMGVRQALLAYNSRNHVGDGCAEPADSGLSLFGRAVVQEMNRVGMVVDGTHSGYRTTMEAMELSSAPFIFSHSNPAAVRPHYRNIRDDQIKACAATGGVIGINGVGYWLGDNDASTEAIFRCVDYTVELVGPEHVGLGFDYIYDLDRLITLIRGEPLAWPAYEGEWMVKHNYAGPEQMVELVDLMLGHDYSHDAIAQILGGNWARIAKEVWK